MFPDSKDIFTDIIWPQIKACIQAVCLSVQERAPNRESSYQLYGYDFMIDEYLKVWLLEVNPSPSLDYQDSPQLKKLSECLLTDLPTVVVDKKTSQYAQTGGF